MNRQKILIDPVLPTKEETIAIKLLDKMLCLNTENGDSETSKLKLVEIGGEEIALPESLYQLLCQAAHLMAAGKAVTNPATTNQKEALAQKGSLFNQ